MTVSNIKKNIIPEKPEVFRRKLLDWYDVNRRDLPWRALERETPNPYHVWLSEIMLQQTTVQAVIPYFIKFITKWPSVKDLAAADNDTVMQNWAGLGYYARARNLHKCAKIITNDFNSVFPSDQNTLKSLPGVGDYTSAAISSIAFNLPANVVDGNVERVMARYSALKTRMPEAKKELKIIALKYAEGFDTKPGDYAQSLMDLGSTICTPKSPSCLICPINSECLSNMQGNAQEYPVKSIKKVKPKRHGAVYWVTNEQDQVLIHKRPQKGLLGGMYGLPTSDWVEESQEFMHPQLNVQDVFGDQEFIVHVFTHFHLKLKLYTAKINIQNFITDDYKWININSIDDIGFPTIFQKAVNLYK